jgi:hypothetical protein
MFALEELRKTVSGKKPRKRDEGNHCPNRPAAAGATLQVCGGEPLYLRPRVACREALTSTSPRPATSALQQMGLDHTRLAYRKNGREETLTDAAVTGARVINEIVDR